MKIRLLQLAKPGEWAFTDSSLITDQEDHEVIERIVFAKLLDHLPNVIPYNLEVQLEYLNRTEEGEHEYYYAIIIYICKISN